MALTAGTKLGPYDVTAPLGAGGMGEVYRARDTRLSRDVAIKVLPTSFAADADRLRRFEQEARATGLLNHPNILQIYDIGTHQGAPYVVSELLEGGTLARLPMGGGAPRDVAERIWAADWGPDGTSLAVVRIEGGQSRLEFPLGKSLYDAVGDDGVRIRRRHVVEHPLRHDREERRAA